MPDNTSEFTNIPSPGTLLAKNRISNDWSVSDVAKSLRLSETQVEALESDDYKNLPGKTYILGYWNSYANLLGISIKDSIEAHKKKVADTVSEITLEPSHQQYRGSAEQSRHRFAVLFALLSAVFLGAIWYWQDPAPNLLLDWRSWRAGDMRTQPASPSGIAPLEALSGDGENQDEEQFQVQSESMISLPEPNFPEEDDPLQYEPEVTDKPYSAAAVNDADGDELLFGDFDAEGSVSIDSDVPGAGIAQSAAAEQGGLVSSFEAPAVAPGETRFRDGAFKIAESEPIADSIETDTNETDMSEAERAGQLAIADQAMIDLAISGKAKQTENKAIKADEIGHSTQSGDTETPISDQSETIISPVETLSTDQVFSANEIILEVDKESWIDVRDNEGERLIYRTVNRGQRLTLVGKPPFSVFIGSAEGVRVEYQGNTVPFKVHESGLFARFNVGPE